MAITVKTPTRFNGVRGGVRFDSGVAKFEDEKKGKVIAEQFGYEVVQEKKAPPKKKTTQKKTTQKKAPAKKETETKAE